MAAAKIESFSVCRFVISLFLLSITFGPTSSRVPESLQADWQVSCLWRNAPKNRRNWWDKCEKVQGVTENVSSHKEAQRHKSGIKLCGFCAFLGLAFIEEDGEVPPQVGLAKCRVFIGNRFPRWGAGVRLYQQQLFVRSSNSEVANVCGRQTSSAYKTIARRPWPSRFNIQGANAVRKCEQVPDHC